MSIEQMPVLDPNNEPVRVVDHTTLHESSGQHHDLTLCTCTYVPKSRAALTTCRQ